MADTLRRGDQLPSFDVRTLAGDVFSYSTIWQHRNLVLVTISESASDTDYVASLFARREDFEQLESVCVITRDRVSGVATPGALVADRWGEIAYVAAAPHVTELPTASELIEWLDYVERRCPECEGEAR